MSNYPTVHLTDLIPDRCNFKDKTFESYVNRWMSSNMPSIPLGMLDTESEIAFERWQIEPDCVHEVERVDWTVWTCDECGETFTEEPDECCYVVDEEGEETETPHAFSKEMKEVYVVNNENINEYLSSQGYIRYEDLSEDYSDVPVDGGDEVLGWDDEGDANGAASEADRCYHNEHGHENSYGFPWAHSYAFIPDGYITDGSLKAAGFRVATYIGGKGDAREDQEFRLAGIDGGGYSFSGAHFAPLVAYHHEARKMTVETDNGEAYITTDDRSDLEKLAAVEEAEAEVSAV